MLTSSTCCAGALDALRAAGAGDGDPCARRAGARCAAAIALDDAEFAGAPYDGVVALGCVIRGDITSNLSLMSARALTSIFRLAPPAAGNGELTVENEAQAIVRADPKQGNRAPTRAALALVRLKRGAA
ncbi:MAG: 6,7-dimethyl-8-ribityllumazine synthase [Methylocystis sp.]